MFLVTEYTTNDCFVYRDFILLCFIVMLILLILAAIATGGTSQLKIIQAVTSGVGHDLGPSAVFDGNNHTLFHSDYAANPKWLKLELEYLSFVKTISVVNR